MNMMPTSYSDLVKERKERAQAVHKEIEGDHLNLGKKISVPRDVMMEELALLSNKGSRMFHERQKRVDRFTLENMKEGPLTVQNGTQPLSDSGKENFRTEIYIGQPGKGDFLSTLKKKAAKKSGNPNSIAPGYSGPLKEIPHEKFNITVIPKSYQSPWRESLTDTEELLHSLNQQLPEPPPKPQFRCFNSANPERSIMLPFLGAITRPPTPPIPLSLFILNAKKMDDLPQLVWHTIASQAL
ncbi:Myozenin-2 [Acipenser ruthenus]|uniref:Myozenin-2 n=1 Tax=Acipenser ruthenus TaxID=7906 RepID=A0A662YL86_ACIRT|nr:Myozenin-2 [Acipenser ruthenus]